MEIKNVIFHHIDKKAEERGIETVKSDYAENLLSPDDLVVKKFCEEIIDSYRTHNPIWGNIDEEKSFHSLVVNQYSDTPENFVDFSQNISDLIKVELSKATMGTGGFVLILNYSYSDTEWLMIIMLKNDEGYGLSELLTLEKRKYLNIKKLNESARINIKQWSENIPLPKEQKKNCLSFMKGKKDEDVTEYFRNALGCIGYQSSNKNTKEVIKAITAYMEDNEYLSASRDSVRTSIHEYFDTQHKSDLEVDLETISRKVDTNYPLEFIEYLKNNNINIDSSFKPSQKSFKSLQKLSFTVGDVRVSFSYDDINEKIILSDQGLLIKSVPPHIVQEMDSYKPRTTQITLQNPDE